MLLNNRLSENINQCIRKMSQEEKERFHQQLYQEKVDAKSYIIQRSKKTGVPIPQNETGLYYHSRYDPEREATAWAREQASLNSQHYVIFGFAFGYHVEALHCLVPDALISVIETDRQLLKLALAHRDLKCLLSSERITIHLTTTTEEVASCMQRLLQDGTSTLILYPAAVKAISESMTDLKELLEAYSHQSLSIRRNSDHLAENFSQNIHRADFAATSLNKKLCQIPLILVAAGPSLDKNIHLIQKVQSYAIILAVGRAVKPLLAAGVMPDLVIITDGQHFVYGNQLEGLGLEIPLIGLSTCDPKAFKRHQGLRGIAFQEGFDLAEKAALNAGVTTTKTGGSVATTALDLAIGWECNPIILVGQDLALEAGRTHAQAAGRGVIRHKETLLRVKGNKTETVMTTKNLNTYRVWMEQRIRQSPLIKVLNATDGGAAIAGTRPCSLKEVLAILKQSEPLESLLNEKLSEPTAYDYLMGEIMGHRKAREKAVLQTLSFTVQFHRHMV